MAGAMWDQLQFSLPFTRAAGLLQHPSVILGRRVCLDSQFEPWWCSAEIFLCFFAAVLWALSCKQQVLCCSAFYTFYDGHWVKLLITKPLSGHLGRKLGCLRPSVFLRKWEGLFCYPQKEKMKIKTQQLVEKVRRSPNDNGSFEVQGKLKK